MQCYTGNITTFDFHMKAIVFDQVENSTKSVLNKFQDCDTGFFQSTKEEKLRLKKYQNQKNVLVDLKCFYSRWVVEVMSSYGKV